MSPRRAPALAALLILLSPAPAASDEIICDPENPSCAPSQTPPEVTTSGDAPGADEEILCDPEHPTCASAAPSAPVTDAAVADAPSDAWTQTRVAARYGLSQLTDLSWAPAPGSSPEAADVLEWIAGLDAQLTHDLSPSARVVMEARLRYWIGARREAGGGVGLDAPRGELDVQLGEVYWTHRGARWTVRAGNLITTWGATDIARPGDIINPRDLRFIPPSAPGAYNAKIAHPAVELGYAGQGWALTGVLVPFFVGDRAPIAGRDLSAASLLVAGGASLRLLEAVLAQAQPFGADELAITLSAPGPPGIKQGMHGAGLRASATIANTDLALAGFYGWDRTPMIRGWDGQQLNLGALRVDYERRASISAEAARTFGPIGARLDAAFSPAQVIVSPQLTTTRRPTAELALGLSYVWLGQDHQLVLSVEGSAQRTLGHDHALTRALVPEADRGGPEDDDAVLLFERDRRLIASPALSWRWLPQDLELTLGGAYVVSPRGLGLLNAQLKRRLGGQLSAVLGVNLIRDARGATSSPLLRAASQAILGVEGAL